jgi:hypothetical protein
MERILIYLRETVCEHVTWTELVKIDQKITIVVIREDTAP